MEFYVLLYLVVLEYDYYGNRYLYWLGMENNNYTEYRDIPKTGSSQDVKEILELYCWLDNCSHRIEHQLCAESTRIDDRYTWLGCCCLCQKRRDPRTYLVVLDVATCELKARMRQRICRSRRSHDNNEQQTKCDMDSEYKTSKENISVPNTGVHDSRLS